MQLLMFCQQPRYLWSIHFLCHHRMHGSTSPVLTATGLLKGKWKISTPYRIDILRLIAKNVTVDYIGDMYIGQKSRISTYLACILGPH